MNPTRRATAIRYVWHHHTPGPITITRSVLGSLFKYTPQMVYKIVKNKAYFDLSYAAFLSGVGTDTLSKKQVKEIIGLHHRMKEWSVNDIWRYFEYNEKEWKVPLLIEDTPGKQQINYNHIFSR